MLWFGDLGTELASARGCGSRDPRGAGSRGGGRAFPPSQGLCCHLSALRGSTARPRPRLPQPRGGLPGPVRAAAGGRSSLPLRQPGTGRAQPLLPARGISPVRYKRIMSRNSRFPTLSRNAQARAVIKGLGFSRPALTALGGR